MFFGFGFRVQEVLEERGLGQLKAGGFRGVLADRTRIFLQGLKL